MNQCAHPLYPRNPRLNNDALPFKLGAFEIQQESQFEATDCEVSDHLRGMRLVKGGHDLRVYNNFWSSRLLRASGTAGTNCTFYSVTERSASSLGIVQSCCHRGTARRWRCRGFAAKDSPTEQSHFFRVGLGSPTKLFTGGLSPHSMSTARAESILCGAIYFASRKGALFLYRSTLARMESAKSSSPAAFAMENASSAVFTASSNRPAFA